MKKAWLIYLFQALSVAAWAQQGALSGSVSDASDQSPIAGAHVILKNTSTAKAFVKATDGNGKFEFPNVPNGQYLLELSFIGYQTLEKKINIADKPLKLETLNLQKGIKLQDVTVVEKSVAAVQRGDTTEFNALAYKTLPDANAEDLVEKMPTVVIEDGTIQAQGEDVKEVLVDGRPFFGEDPKAALKNLPAEVIDKIQIFDKKSEQASFTGFDDGETTKTINIITKVEMRNGTFGRFYGGYGYKNKYTAGGNINIFNGDRRISILGMSNNINQQNFSTDDILGVVGSSGRKGGRRGGGRPGGGGGRGGGGGASASDFMVSQQGGITTSNAIGFNYSDKWGENMEVTTSYFFNHSDNNTEQTIKQQYYDSEGLQERYDEESRNESTNANHRLNSTLRYTLDDKNSFVLRPRLSWQGNSGHENVLGTTSLDGQTLNQIENDFNADLSALNFSSMLLWRHKFDTRRRTFSINANVGYSPKKGESYLYSEDLFEEDELDQITQQQATLDQNQWNASANIMYTEPVFDQSMLMLSFSSSFQQEQIEKETFDYNDDSEAYDVLNNELSNVFSNDYLTQNLSAGLMMRAGLSRFMLRAGLQRADLYNEQVEPFEETTNKTFWNVLPMAMWRYRVSKEKNVSVRYYSRSQLPSIDNLQEVIDNSNPLQLSIGNSKLSQSVSHNVRAKYTNTNTKKSTVFFVMFSGTYTQDYIANSTYLSLDDFGQELNFDANEGAQISQPVNMDGQWNLRSFITYGFPLRPIKSNLNIDLSGNYTRTPGLINATENIASNKSVGAGFTLSSNLSTLLDFTLSTRSNYSMASNSIQAASETTYLNQNTRLKFNLVAGRFVFRTDLTHKFYDGLSSDFEQNYFLLNASLGLKLFKSNRGELSVSAFDLFKQNTSLARNVTEVYTEDIMTNTLQRYFMLTFRYDLRQFKSAERPPRPPRFEDFRS